MQKPLHQSDGYCRKQNIHFPQALHDNQIDYADNASYMELESFSPNTVVDVIMTTRSSRAPQMAEWKLGGGTISGVHEAQPGYSRYHGGDHGPCNRTRPTGVRHATTQTINTIASGEGSPVSGSGL
jgi:hypothetical protein